MIVITLLLSQLCAPGTLRQNPKQQQDEGLKRGGDYLTLEFSHNLHELAVDSPLLILSFFDAKFKQKDCLGCITFSFKMYWDFTGCYKQSDDFVLFSLLWTASVTLKFKRLKGFFLHVTFPSICLL